MNEVRLPIETTREGNKITKVCVEDVYKMLNRIIEAMDKAHNNAIDIIDSIHKEYGDYEGSLIIGTGISQPCMTDAFDEEIGNNIAFMKAKLNANLKKMNIIRRVWNEYGNVLKTLDKESQKIAEYVVKDVEGVRLYNPEYLMDKLDFEIEED